MKKILAMILTLSALTTCVYAEDENVTVKVYKQELTDKGVIINGRTLLPVREVYEKLGFTVEYNAEEKSATVKKGSLVNIKYTANNDKMQNNGNDIPMDVPAQIINDKFMMPIRSINNAMYLDIKWDGETKTVYVDKPDDVNVTVINVS